MKKFGIISYNIYCSFTNYGSALQSWALHQMINRLGQGRWESVLIDYCPDILLDKNPLDPFQYMWDQDTESRRMCELSMPAIRENYNKFDEFYHHKFNKTVKKYTSSNFEQIIQDENIDGFICGSDTIFCIDEFTGFDDGYYANYLCMKNSFTISYAASFGDSHFTEESYKILRERLLNFKALGLREKAMLDYVQKHTTVPVKQTIDPTLLLRSEDYDSIVAPRLEEKKYLLLYVRRYNQKMETFADELAAANGWEVIEISLRATNTRKHRMFYHAGVEEFLSLVKHAEFVVTNSFHGMIFSVQYKRQFVVFSREQCDSKITELLNLLGISDRLMMDGNEGVPNTINYAVVHSCIDVAKKSSIEFLKSSLEKCE